MAQSILCGSDYLKISDVPRISLGGFGSSASSYVWLVAGVPCLIREWALRRGWGGRPVRVEQAQGILAAALGVLAGFYGYGGR